jgi:hypothetical protein
VLIGGRLVEPLPTLRESQIYAADSIRRLPIATRSLFDSEQKYRVEHSRELQRLLRDTRASHSVPVSQS